LCPKAIVSPKKYSVGYKMGQDGLLYPARRIHSMVSRIQSLHRNIAKSRAKFEATPDRGLLGKNFTRIFNLIWNYICKGLVGTTMFLLFYPVINTLLSTLSIIIGITTPVWILPVMILYYLFQILIFDLKRPSGTGCRLFYLFHIILYKLLILGVCQPVACVFLALVGYPLAAIVLCILGSLQICTRSTYDFLVYHIFLKRIARVPATNSFAARKIAGPGMASQFFLQMNPEHALVPVFYWVDRKILYTWEQMHRKQIAEPVELYKKFFNSLFEPFSCAVNDIKGNDQFVRKPYSAEVKDIEGPKGKHPVYQKLVKEESAHTKKLNDISQAQSENLFIDIPQRHLIRLRSEDLDKLIMMSAQYLAAVIPENLFPYYDEEGLVKFWKQREIRKDDWVSLARVVLTEIYSDPFMVPLEETDLNCAFKLKVEELTLSSYLEGVISTDIEDPLEAHSVTYQRLSNNVQVTPPRQHIQDIGSYLRHRELIEYREICAQYLKDKLPFMSQVGNRLVNHIWSELGDERKEKMNRRVKIKSFTLTKRLNSDV